MLFLAFRCLVITRQHRNHASYLFLEKNESVFKLSLSQALGQWGCSKKQAGDERGLGSSPLTESLEQANMFLTLNNLWVVDLYIYQGIVKSHCSAVKTIMRINNSYQLDLGAWLSIF